MIEVFANTPPSVYPGQRIGLYGGSFNPPHAGHLMTATKALRALQLDAVWWLVAPGNPFKPAADLLPQAERMRLCAEMAADPKQRITGFEAGLGGETRTWKTVRHLTMRHPAVRFVWIAGADCVAEFHLWPNIDYIMRKAAVAAISRTYATYAAFGSPFAHRYRHCRVRDFEAPALLRRPLPGWTFIHGHWCELSSTAIRQGLVDSTAAAKYHPGNEA